MERILFAIVTNEEIRSERAVEEFLQEYISLGAPWLCWFLGNNEN